jgi:hypothetical protein
MMDDDSNDDNHSDDSNDDNHSDDSNDDNHSDDSNDDNHSDDSNRSSCWSDLDASENYVEFLERLKRHEEYWNKLGHGILSHPAPLQVQCLLSIVGNLDQFPSTALGLLPAHLRLKLLLLLPVVDVCKLEGTPLTDGLSMNDVWESLYYARMPIGVSEFKECLMEPKSFSESFGIRCNWKEAYFQSFFFMMQSYQQEIYDYHECIQCDCIYEHFISDMLYGVYKFDGVLDAYCFKDSCSKSLHNNLRRYTDECPRFTRFTYLEKVSTTIDGTSKHHIHDLVELFSDICSPFKFFIFDLGSLDIWKYCWNYVPEGLPGSSPYHQHINFPPCLFSSLEGLKVNTDHGGKLLETIVEAIFKSQCKLNAIFLCSNDIINVFYPYLVKAECSSLKILQLQNVNYTNSHLVCEILCHHTELQRLLITFRFDDNKTHETARDVQDLFQSIIRLMQRPSLIELYLDYDNNYPLGLIDILRQFCSSPYSITLQIFNAVFNNDFTTNELPFEMTNMSLKSLVIVESSLPQSIFSLLPSNLHFDDLELCNVNLKHIVELDSIFVEGIFKFSLDDRNDLGDISSLFRIATATEWEIDVSLNNRKAFESFTNALLIIKGKINKLKIQNSLIVFTSEAEDSLDLVHFADVLSLLEVIFKLLDSSLPPYFELKITLKAGYFNEDNFKSIHNVWKKCGAVQLKKIQLRVDDRHVNETYIILPVLSKMAVNISCDACI